MSKLRAITRDCAEGAPSSRRFLWWSAPSKILLYGSMRVIYPLLTFFTEDWGLSREEVLLILACAELASIPAGMASSLADSYGNRGIGVSAWWLFLIGNALTLLPPSVPGLICARIIANAFGTLYIVCAQSSLVNSVPADQAGFVTGVSETGWALSILTLVPLLAIAYANLGWRAPFVIICGIGIVVGMEIMADFPSSRTEKASTFPVESASSDLSENDHASIATSQVSIGPTVTNRSMQRHVSLESNASTGSTSKYPDHKSSLCKTLRSKPLWQANSMPGMIRFNLAGFFFHVSSNVMFIAFATWATETQGVDVEGMGAVSFTLGGAELVGSLAVLLYGDKWGLYESQYWAFLYIFVATGVFVGLSSLSLVWGIVGVCLVLIASEYIIVSEIALTTGYVPQELSTSALGGHFTWSFVGRSVGVISVEALWKLGGIYATSATCGMMYVLCFLAIRSSGPFYVDPKDECLKDNDEGNASHEIQRPGGNSVLDDGSLGASASSGIELATA